MNLSAETIREIRVAVPPRAEQLRISDFVEQECARFDGVVAKSEQGIELLREHRTALISAAVTGKIDVRSVDAGGDLLT
jgi:type I restriction enzyme S subunit